MSKRAIRWLYQELPELVTKNILTRDAADKLRQYYGEVKSVSKTWVTLAICGVAGALLIGLGIILIFAHNWEQLSRSTRAVLSFLPLAIGQALALWAIWKRPDSSIWKESTATFLSLMVGASIALISQTYNIQSDAGTFILTWMFLILPLVYFMQASIPAVIYLIGISSWAIAYWDRPAMAILFWPLAAAVIFHFVWSLRKDTYNIRSSILSLAMALCLCFGAGLTLEKDWPGLWIIIYSSIYAILYYLGRRKFSGVTRAWQRPLHILGTIGIVIFGFEFTFHPFWEYLFRESYVMNTPLSGWAALLGHFIAAVIIITAILFFYDTLKRKDLNVSLFTVFPLLAYLAFILNGKPVNLLLLIFNAYLLVLSVSRIMSGVRNRSMGSLNFGMLILAILIILRFFDSDISFVFKGLVFIIVGIGFLTSNVLLLRQRGGAK